MISKKDQKNDAYQTNQRHQENKSNDHFIFQFN